MSAYRDALEAAHQRIAELEDALDAQRQGAELGPELEQLRRRLERSQPATARRPTREAWIVLGAMVAVVLAIFQYASRLEAERALESARSDLEGIRAELSRNARNQVMLADPLPQAPKKQRRHPQLDVKAHKELLFGKLTSGTASSDEARMLKTICFLERDEPCRSQAVAYLERFQATH